MAEPQLDDSGTRARVIQAALDCILDRGFYRASSNEIARRAGVTWGVIQYHFGTRERLLVAALRDATGQLVAHLERADVSGATVEERVRKCLAVLAGWYGSPTYLAYLQIILNLSHDPATSADAAQALTESNDHAQQRITELLDRVVGRAGSNPELRAMLFHVGRGFALSNLITEAATPGREPVAVDAARVHERTELLILALAVLLER